MRRTILKILEMVVAVILVFSLAACGSTIKSLDKTADMETGKPPLLTLWHQWVVEDNTGVNTLNNAIKEWNGKNPDKMVQALGVNTEQYKIKIKSALAAGDAPDIFYMWGGSFSGPYIKNGNILPLDEFLDDGTKDKLIPGTLEACTFNGKVYSLPMFTFVANLYCNTELFDKAGAQIPSTYDDLLIAVNKLRNARITPIVVGEKDRWPGMYWFSILAMREAGAQACMDALDNPSLFDQPAFLSAAQKLVELIDAGAFNEDALSIGFSEMLDEFKDGKAAMIYQGNWIDAVIEGSQNEAKGNIKAVPFPLIPGGKGIVEEFMGGNVDGFYINVNTKYKEEAVEVLKFISEKASKQGYLSGAGLPCWKMDEADEDMVPPLTKNTAELMRSGKSFVDWWDTILPAADSDVLKGLIAELYAGKMSPEGFINGLMHMDGVTDIKPYENY